MDSAGTGREVKDRILRTSVMVTRETEASCTIIS